MHEKFLQVTLSISFVAYCFIFSHSILSLVNIIGMYLMQRALANKDSAWIMPIMLINLATTHNAVPLS